MVMVVNGVLWASHERWHSGFFLRPAATEQHASAPFRESLWETLIGSMAAPLFVFVHQTMGESFHKLRAPVFGEKFRFMSRGLLSSGSFAPTCRPGSMDGHPLESCREADTDHVHSVAEGKRITTNTLENLGSEPAQGPKCPLWT